MLYAAILTSGYLGFEVFGFWVYGFRVWGFRVLGFGVSCFGSLKRLVLHTDLSMLDMRNRCWAKLGLAAKMFHDSS